MSDDATDESYAGALFLRKIVEVKDGESNDTMDTYGDDLDNDEDNAQDTSRKRCLSSSSGFCKMFSIRLYCWCINVILCFCWKRINAQSCA